MSKSSKDQIGQNKVLTSSKSLAEKGISLGSGGNGIGSSKSLGGPGQTGKRLK
jgi:hypothetical protein